MDLSVVGSTVSFGGHLFFPEYEHVLSHVRAFNPHPPGSSRDALTHGLNPSKYLWTAETVSLALSLFKDVECVGHVLDYRAMIARGSPPPAIVVEISPSGYYWILDGAHRVVAAQKEGLAEIKAYVGIEKGRWAGR